MAYLFSILILPLIAVVFYFKLIAFIVGGSWALLMIVSYVLAILKIVFGPWPLKAFGLLMLVILLLETAVYFNWGIFSEGSDMTLLFDMEFFGIKD